MSIRACWLAALAAGVGLIGGCIKPGGGFLVTPVPADRQLQETVLRRDPGLFVADKIVVIDVEGLLANQETGSLFGVQENPVSLFVEKLNAAAGDPDVKAVLVRINSPGGTVSASEIMHHELLRLRRRRPEVKVAAQILDLGASGGYYVACGAEKIYALPSSITGSIGVIFQTFSIEDTLRKIGVSTLAIKSGKLKDLASPLHERRQEEIKLLDGIIDQYFQGFLAVVLAGRPNLTRAQLLEGEAPLADGRVFTGVQAKAVGLVDELKYPEEALAQLKKDANIARGKVVIYRRPIGYKGSIYAASPVGQPAATAAPTVNLINVELGRLLGPRQPSFLYLYTGP